MAQLAQSWNRIPYDVWERIFDLFDKQTLLSACLVNLTIHDIASRSLYATLIINKGRGYHMWRSPAERKDHFKDAFLAFDRKPDLRLVVKDVILYPSAITAAWFHNNADNIDMDCYAQLQKLLNVRKVTLNGRFGSKELDHFLDSMSTLALLESLVITDPISRRFDGTLSLGPSGDYKKLDRIQDLSLSFAGNELDSWVVGSIASKIKKLTLESYDSTGIGYRLEALLRLQKLDITMSSPDPMKLCETVAVSKDLTQITLEFIWPKWEVVVPDITMDLPDTGLAKLTSLTIRLRSRWGDKEIKLLQNLVPALAGRSRLRKLAIVGPNSYPPYTHIQCHHLMAHVISVHGPTLEKLKVPFFHMSKAILERIMARCEKLKILWAPAREELRPYIPQILACSRSMETLRLYGTGKWLGSYAKSLLSQPNQNDDGSSLREVKICGAPDCRIVPKVVWKVSWEYDAGLGRAVRRLLGPTACKIKEPERQPRFGGSEDEGDYMKYDDDDDDDDDWRDQDEDMDEDDDEYEDD